MDRLGWWFFGGREKSLLASSSTDVVTLAGAAFLFEGPRVYPFHTPHCVPGETLGLVRTAAAASSFSFLKVLLGTRRFEVLEVWWEFSRGRSGGGLSLFC
jgi:hypothetical protein